MKKILIAFTLFFKENTPRIAIIPYPFYNREYPIPLTKKIQTNALIDQCYDSTHNSWEMVFNGVFFYRSANRSYNSSQKNKQLAAIIHGSDNFDVSDSFPERKQIIISHNEYYKDLLGEYEYLKYDGLVQPNYNLIENGYLLACDIVRKISQKTSFALQTRIPIIQQEITHQKGWNSITNQKKNIHDSRLYIDNHNKYFQVRLDFLEEKNLLPEDRSLQIPLKGLHLQQSITEDYFSNKPCANEEINFSLDDTYIDINSGDIRNFIDKKNLYIATKFNLYAEPTAESVDFYNTIEKHQKEISTSDYVSILQGKYLNKNYSWQPYQRNYFAPADIQANITKIIDNLIIQGMLAAVIPIEKKAQKDDYLALSYFDNHYGMRIGTQINYGFKKHYSLIGYLSYQYNFPHMQKLPAIFDNQSAYGITPLYITGKVSWYDIYASLHLLVKANEKYGADIGYQYIYKSGDNVIPEVESFYLLNGEKEKLTYEPWKKFTESNAQLIVFSGYYLYKSLQIEISTRTVFHGKNIPELKEISLRCGLDF